MINLQTKSKPEERLGLRPICINVYRCARTAGAVEAYYDRHSAEELASSLTCEIR